jgi:phosphate binding protein
VKPTSLAFGKYRLVATLGRGGTADVFLAVMRGAHGFEKLLVVKRLRADVEEDDVYRALLSSEARVAARLSHPNIVQTYEVGEHDGRAFLAMEYLDGQPLNRVINLARRAGGQPLPTALSVRIIADALAGLHYAHELKDFDGRSLDIVHRDVSPHNIFVTYEGVVKLVDFGIAKARFDDSTTEVGVLKGKLAYMAPEQAIGERLDRRADLFAMGIVLFEMLASRRLFHGDTATEVSRRLLQEPIPRLSEVVFGCDPTLDAICARALEKDVDARYPTAEAMRDELERWLSAHGGYARDDVRRWIHETFEAEHASTRASIHGFIQAVRDEEGHTPPLREPTETSPSSAFLPRLGPPSLTPPASPNAASAASGKSLAETVADRLPQSIAQSPPAPRRRRWIAPVLVGLLAVSLAGVFFVFRARGRGAIASTSASGSPSGGAGPASASKGVVVVDPPFALRLCGSNTIGESMAPALVEAFFRKRGAQVSRSTGARPHATRVTAREGEAVSVVEIEAEGSATAFTGLAKGTCDLGMASRPIHDDEAKATAAAGLGDLRTPASELVVALDGIAVVVHPNRAQRSLTLEQIAKIFSGEIDDWSGVGAPAAPIVVLARDDKSGTFDTFQHLVLGKRKLAAKATRWADSDKLSDAVAADANAIGFIGLAYVRSAKALAVADKGATPNYPSVFTVTTESYLLSRRLYFYVPAKPTRPLTLDFTGYALSAEGQSVVRDAGFVDLGVGIREASDCAACTPGYAHAVAGARRLSLDFRFRPGLDQLDSRATRDLDRLVVFLRAHPGGRLRLFGFSDAAGEATTNLLLSQQRARVIGDELEARGAKPAVVAGFGAEMPVASNDTPEGRERNRRVEVWLESSEDSRE